MAVPAVKRSIIFLLAILPGFSQYPDWRHYTPTLTINTLLETKDHIFAGTDNGLTRINKNTGATENYNKINSSLTYQKIRHLIADSSGGIWILSYHSGYRRSITRPIWCDSTMDCRKSEKSMLYKFENGSFTIYDSASTGEAIYEVEDVAFSGKFGLCIGTVYGLLILKNNSWSIFDSTNSPMPFTWVSSVASDPDGNLWIGASMIEKDYTWSDDRYYYSGSLIRYNGTDWTAYTGWAPNHDSGSYHYQYYVGNIEFDQAGMPWIEREQNTNFKYVGTYTSLAAMDIDSTWQMIHYGNSALTSSDGIYSLIKCGDGGLLCFCGFVASVKFNTAADTGTRIVTPDTTLSLLKYDTSSLIYGKPYPSTAVYDENYRLWIGGSSGLVWTTEQTGAYIPTVEYEIPVGPVLKIAVSPDNQLWATTYYSLLKFDMEDWTIYDTSFSRYFSGTKVALDFDDFGNVWIGEDYTGLLKFNGSSCTTFSILESGIHSNEVRDIVIDKGNRIWAAVSNWNYWPGGIAVLDGETWATYTNDNAWLANDAIDVIAIDSNGGIWAGSSDDSYLQNEGGGITYYDGNAWKIYTKINSTLPSERHIYDICITPDNTIWIGTDSGLAHFDRTNWNIYDVDNSALPGNRIYALCPDRDSILWIGTDSGLVSFKNGEWSVFNELNSGLTSNNITGIAVDEWNHKWIKTSDYGFSVFRENGITVGNDRKPNMTVRYHPNSVDLFPNPFNPTTTLSFALDRPGLVSIKVYNVKGDLIEILMDSYKDSGRYSVKFSADKYSSGIYYFKLVTGNQKRIMKGILIK